MTSMVIGDLVRELGCEVVGPTDSLQEALKLADGGDLDGAVLDVNLGGLPVYSVADRLAFRQIPFVFLTGYANAIPPAHADRRMIEKPFRHGELARVLAEVFKLEEAAPVAGCRLPA